MSNQIDRLIELLATRMAEIDGDITRSMYIGNSDDDSLDRPPEGDDYNLLFDAIVDECNALRPGVFKTAMARHMKPEFV